MIKPWGAFGSCEVVAGWRGTTATSSSSLFFSLNNAIPAGYPIRTGPSNRQGSVLLRRLKWWRRIHRVERIDPSQIEPAELRAKGSDAAHVGRLGAVGSRDR